MLDKFVAWYRYNYFEITWFLIGFLVMAGLADFGKGDWVGALMYWAIAAFNYFLRNK
jgi:hypothetical protein